VLEPATVFSIVKQVALGLRYVHRIGYVHQDIKPSNILLDSTGRAIISDFGIGHTFQSAELFIGSPAFQSPEALDEASEDPRGQDVWALGVTLYVTLFGRVPYFGCNIFEVVSEIMEHELAIPEGTDPRVAALLRGMLAVDPAERFSIDELIANELIAGAPDRAPNIPDVPLPREKVGDIVQVTAAVCNEEYSFAGQVVGHQRRSSFDDGIMGCGAFGNFR
jgi:serine/threonine-protein kinase 11